MTFLVTQRRLEAFLKFSYLRTHSVNFSNSNFRFLFTKIFFIFSVGYFIWHTFFFFFNVIFSGVCIKILRLTIFLAKCTRKDTKVGRKCRKKKKSLSCSTCSISIFRLTVHQRRGWSRICAAGGVPNYGRGAISYNYYYYFLRVTFLLENKIANLTQT